MVKLSDDGKWFRVSLRLTGDELNVEEITAKLGIEPSTSRKKGDPSRFGEQLKTNVWVWRYPVDSDVSFEIQINDLLEDIESKKHILKELISSPGVTGELFLGHGSVIGEEVEFLSPEILRRIAEFGLTVDLDLY